MHNLVRHNQPLWDLFTGLEEYEPPFRDEFGRFPHYYSRNANIMTASVSKFLTEQGLTFDYPNGEPYALCLTHDVDLVRLSWFGIAEKAAKAIRERDFGKLGKALSHTRGRIARGHDPYWNFSDIISTEEDHGAKSSFYFLARRIWEGGWSYETWDLQDELRAISKAGWEVGLHGSPKSVLDAHALEEERDVLTKCAGRKIVGYRSHYLRFQVPTTWEILAQSGFEYDSSYGTPYCVGFRNGMCHPFLPFNLRTNRVIDILEIPVNVMDFSFARYMRVTEDVAWEITKSLLATTQSLGGVLTVLWHNSYAENFGTDFYKRILKFGVESGAWMTSAEELASWWRKRHQTETDTIDSQRPL